MAAVPSDMGVADADLGVQLEMAGILDRALQAMVKVQPQAGFSTKALMNRLPCTASGCMTGRLRRSGADLSLCARFWPQATLHMPDSSWKVHWLLSCMTVIRQRMVRTPCLLQNELGHLSRLAAACSSSHQQHLVCCNRLCDFLPAPIKCGYRTCGLDACDMQFKGCLSRVYLEGTAAVSEAWEKFPGRSGRQWLLLHCGQSQNSTCGRASDTSQDGQGRPEVSDGKLCSGLSHGTTFC